MRLSILAHLLPAPQLPGEPHLDATVQARRGIDDDTGLMADPGARAVECLHKGYVLKVPYRGQTASRSIGLAGAGERRPEMVKVTGPRVVKLRIQAVLQLCNKALIPAIEQVRSPCAARQTRQLTPP
ncbi:MAG: hypothetical protein NVSMB3_12340 [Acidobacteriaceae bacterium]